MAKTTNYNFNLPTVGGDTDAWGSQLNANWISVDTTIKNLSDSITQQDVEDLGNVLSTTPSNDQVLQFNGQNWGASTLAISDISGLQTELDDKATSAELSALTVTIADGAVSFAKLNSSLQTQVNRILVLDDTDTPADNEILKYSSSSQKWLYSPLPGTTIQTLDDVNTTSLADDTVLVWSATASEFQFEAPSAFRTTLGLGSAATTAASSYATAAQGTTADSATQPGDLLTTLNVSGADRIIGRTAAGAGAATEITCTSAGRALLDDANASAQRTTLGLVIGTDVQAFSQALSDVSGLSVSDGNIIVGNGANWVAESGATARASLGLTIGADVEAYSSTNADYSDETANFTGTLQNGGSNVVVDSDIGASVQAWDQQLDDIAALTPTDSNIIVGNGTTWVAESGATARTSLGLGSLATQDNITESQITDLGSYLTAETNDLSAAVTWTTVPDAYVSQSSVTQHLGSYATTGKAIAMAIVFGG